jgi:putative DNA primase/helicase
MKLFRGYVPTKNKECTMSFKGKTSEQLMSLEEVQKLPEYAGILADETVLIDLDDSKQAEMLMDIVEDLQLNCKVIDTTRGKHFLFHNNGIKKCATHAKLACGLNADIKVGSKNSYEVLKFNNQERFCEWDIEDGQEYQDIPKWLFPVKSKEDFISMKSGDGRNTALFTYELTLQSQGFTKAETKECINIINKYILKDSMSDQELETITRDEGFAKPLFFQDGKFMHEVFGNYIRSEFHIKRINGQLHVYSDGIYVVGYRLMENKMIQVIPHIKANQRAEVLKYLEATTIDNEQAGNPNLIAFRNGIYDIRQSKMVEFSPEYTITNKIPWDYNPNAYSELADKTLDKMACKDKEIRALLEECIGYCFYTQNEMSKSFMLTGSGSNGKSTYLDMVKNVLGRQNYVSLDIDELSEKFSTSSMFGKLANIGDDISDEFLQGKAVAQFKKIVSGNDIKAENKGQDVFFFKPTVKLLFSANEIPRFRNKGFQAIKRRLVIIPFLAEFSPDDVDYDAGITWKLKTQETAEYLIKIGIDRLKNIIANQKFTESAKVKAELEEFEEDNNPIVIFLKEVSEDDIINHETREVYVRYDTFCHENGYQHSTIQTFSKLLVKTLGLKIKDVKIKGRKTRMYAKEGDKE